MKSIEPIPAFSDNYIWALVGERYAWIVDPGAAAPVRKFLSDRSLALAGILVTHWHPDHIGGISDLLRDAAIPVVGPAGEAQRIGLLTRQVADGDLVELLARSWRVIEVPGHTLGHIAYYSEGHLLCGDTLFSAGCGRLFEGTPEQMHHSLSRLSELPDDTQVYCAHEYTAANLAFAKAVEPDSAALREAEDSVHAARQRGLPSLPSTIGREHRINPFLRVGEPAVIAAARAQGAESDAPATVFATLRNWKDNYKAQTSR